MSAPLVPPRPSRASATTTTTKDSLPEVPPRPFRKLDPSPSREMRSPLNELPNPMGSLPKRRSQNNLQTPEVPLRPSIQTIPSIGQEGFEYASFDVLPAEAHSVESTQVDAPEQTRNVSATMPLHAPKAELAKSTAKSRIETVTGTNSTQAAAIGIGKAKPKDDVHMAPADSTSSLSRVTTKADELKRIPSTEPHLKSKTSFSRSPSLHPVTSRPGSMFNEGNHEQGIPEIGMQIPLNPNAGDVQAPSPAPTQSQFTPGIGFFNDGSARAHVRRTSSRQEFGPPGSYGLHSHGQEPHDQFEREWIAKNPDRAAIEGSHVYGTPRPETALTTAELNKLVNQNTDVGMGTNPEMVGTPGEEVAWGATDEYTARWTSPKPSPLPTSERQKRRSSGNLPSAKPPLRKTSYGFMDRKMSNEAIENEDDVIHVDPAERKWNKVTGGGAADGTLDLGPRGGNTEERGGWFDEQGYGTPILASDEIVKRPGSAFMQPAVDPEAEHHDYESDEYDKSRNGSRRSSMRVPSRPSSRPNSMHGEYQGGNLYRFISHDELHGSGIHTPLEEIEEYEPLIPEGQEESPKPKPKAKKRPGLENHHFPSQDVWEDTPSSLQYQTTVETPEPPVEARAAPPPATSKPTAFETPEQEQERKEENPNDMFSDNKTFIKPALRDEMRPGRMHRFPSRDIWEDTPDSMMGVTTVSGPQEEEVKSPPEDRPTTAGQDEGDTRATTGFTQTRRPSIPARPLRKSKLAEELKPEDPDEPSESTSKDISGTTAQAPPSPEKAKPAIPDRPKPSIPPRPARPSRDAADGVELAKSISPEDGPPINKVKPAVPARPAGEKIAALKAGFMNDLNNRLKLGPQGPPPKAKEPEPEAVEETTRAPLADARKGRAKGPARRKPAAEPSAVEEKPAAFSISSMITIWEIDESDRLQVPSLTVTDVDAPAPTDAEALVETAVDAPQLAQEMAANEAANTTEPTLAEPKSPEKAESIPSPPPEASSTDQASEVQSLEQKLAQAQAKVSTGGSEEQGTTAEVGEKELVPGTADADVETKELAPAISDHVDAKVDAPASDPATVEAEKDVSVTDHANVMEEHKATEMAKTADEGIA